MGGEGLGQEDRVAVRAGLLTLACFFLLSTGWLLWMYHLADFTQPVSVDVLTMVVGYLMQAAGVAAFVYLSRERPAESMRRMSMASLVAYVACLVPATVSADLTPVLAFGYLANVLCGFVEGYYLDRLARCVTKERRGVVFGGAYAASTALSWLIAVVAEGALTRGVPGLALCAVLAVVALAMMREELPALEWETPATEDDGQDNMRLVALACVVVTSMSLTKNAGFGFPAADLLEGVSVEFSRLFYGFGLLAAGLTSDKNRRYGALCTSGALVMPFLMLALSGAAAPATIMWALGYLLFGFFSLYRVLLLADLAAEQGQPALAGAGLLFGRVGDALGTALSTSLGSEPLLLITIASVLFACTMALFFVLYQRLYVPAPAPPPTERQIFERFAAAHDLSSREREVLRLVLDEHSNSEIATELFVSEATVKYHVRNLLRKTGCKNRLEVIAKYTEA